MIHSRTYLLYEASRKWQTLSHHQTSMDWLCQWHNQTAHVVTPSMALTFVTKMSEKRKSTSPSVIQVRKMISTEEKLNVIRQLEKGEWTADIWCNVRFAPSISTICDNADRITESAKSGTKVCVARLPQSEWNKPRQHLRMWVSYILIALEINKYIV